jgi:copper chaperone CopZ
LPLLLIAFGASGGALATKFEALRPVLLPVTFAFLGLAFYLTYRKPRAIAAEPSGTGERCCVVPTAEKDASHCCPPKDDKGFRIKRLNKVVLLVTTIFVLVLAFFPNYVGLLFGSNDVASTRIDANPVEWAMTIEGMTCQGCAAQIESELRKFPGVVKVNVDYEKGSAMVVAASTVGDADLQGVVEAAGYSISSIERKTNHQGGSQ